MLEITAFMQRSAPKEIRFHHLAEEIHRDLFHRPPCADTSVVHENVDVAALCKRFANRITYGSGFRQGAEALRSASATRNDIPLLPKGCQRKEAQPRRGFHLENLG